MFLEKDQSEDQSSEEWIKWRSRGIGASDAASLMCISPWRSLTDLYKEKLTGKSEIKENYAMARGKELEPFARDIYEHEYKVKAPAKNFIHKRFNFIRCSLDGYVEGEHYGVEIKTPLSTKEIDKAKKGIITTKYIPQLEWQVLTAELKYVDFVTYDGSSQIYVSRYEPRRELSKALAARAVWFWKRLQMKKEITFEDELLCLLKTKKLFTDLGISLED